MTNLITLTIPNDDHIALRAFGKALEEMALAHGASPTQLQVVNEITMTGEQTEALRERLKEVLGAPRDEIAEQAGIDPAVADAYVQGCHDTEARLVETDTTAQQVQSLATNVVQREVEFNNPHPETSDATTDSTNTPWDERIHSASKALNSDGTWRLRRKPKDMDEAEWAAFISQVGSEIHPDNVKAMKEFAESLPDVIEQPFDTEQQSVNLDHVSINDIPEPPVTPPGDDFHTDAGVVTEQSIAGIAPIPVPPPVVVPPVPVADEQWDFPKLMTFLTERQGKIDVTTVNMLLAQDGIASLPELNTHPDKIGPFVARVKAHLGE